MRKRVLPGGMVRLEIVLAPDEADMVMKAIDCAREKGPSPVEPPARRPLPALRGEAGTGVSAEAEGDDESPAWPSRADGLVALADSFLAGNRGSGTGGDRYQVTVHVDQDPLAPDGVMAATLEDGTGVSAGRDGSDGLCPAEPERGKVWKPSQGFHPDAPAHRLRLRVVAVAGSDPVGMTVGRRTRAIPPAIRRALVLRDRGCCFPGCTHTRFLHGHHWRHWLHGGETSLANLLLLCPFHHGLVHEGGWSVERDEEGRFTFVAPTGKSVSAETREEWHGNVATWLQEWADAHGLCPATRSRRLHPFPDGWAGRGRATRACRSR